MSTPSTSSPMIVHNVYFALNDNSPAAVQHLLSECRKYLDGHTGVVHFSCGTVCPTLTRPVNVRDFDVALHVIFRSMADHDAYQVHARHQQFIAENKANWKQVRVFDSEAY